MPGKYRESKFLDMPSIESGVLAQWKESSCFEESINQRDESNPFVFYEGPPSANGMPGIHHVISRTLKDLVCRYKTMKGFRVERKAGWDTHGLPVELGVEKELGITKEDIGKKISVEEYNRKCREVVMRYKDKWEEITEKMGYWVDMKDPYVTFTNEYIETLWWALKELYKKDLLYKSVSIQPYSPAAGTGLSSHELNQPGTYKDVRDTTVVAMFELDQDDPSNNFHSFVAKVEQLLLEHPDQTLGLVNSHIKTVGKIYFLAWTTTPWTLPSNCGLTVGPFIHYNLVATYNPYTGEPINVILAKPLLHKHFNKEYEHSTTDLELLYDKQLEFNPKKIPYIVLGNFQGYQLQGLRYKQLLPFESNTRKVAGGDPWRVVTGDFVTTDDGTGIVHTAPAFGADDFRMGKVYNLGILTLVNKQGRFIDNVGEFSGRYVKDYTNDPDYKDVDVDIAVKLKLSGHAFKIEKYEHSYPHCWRTDKPIIYYPLDAWFIKTTALKERMSELNKTIRWKPKATGEGRFGNWLENMVDWNLSRSRFWGTPLPVWSTADNTERKCIGSIDELMEEIAKANAAFGLNQTMDRATLDLHKPYVDRIVLVSESGARMEREPDLIDVWFDSGAMPYAQLHYPFDKSPEKNLRSNFPADFIAEGVDQTRGWFYTLHALSVMLFDSVAYKTVVSNGLVLDRDGNKMSKRVGNVIDPFSTIDKYGADATRWYLITNASPWDSLRFDIEGIKEVSRKFFGTLFNTYQFFALYANLDGFSFEEAYIPVAERPEIDRWIISSLHSLVQKVTAMMDDYEPTQAGRAMEYFLDEQLSNWYVRLCRRRFWKGDYGFDKIAAYQTLYECIETLTLLMAPIAPFFADHMFGNLNAVTGKSSKTSVHLEDFPVANATVIDRSLEERMQMAQDVSSLILSIRKKVNIKVRQPLQRCMVPVSGEHMKQQLMLVEDLIKNETNIKELAYLTDSDGFIKKKIKANFKSLGARMGAKMKAVAAAIGTMSQTDIRVLESTGAFQLALDGDIVEINTKDADIVAEDVPGFSVANKDALTVALDITVSEELANEGVARELVNRIQKLRKESGLEVTDRISVNIQEFTPIINAVIKFKDYLCAEILADDVQLIAGLTEGTEVEVNDTAIKISIKKI